MLQGRYSTFNLEAGCDEVGRGCLAGPVVAASVILPINFSSELIKDSKKLSKKKLIEADSIIKQQAICYSIKEVDATTIDKINILNASILGMHLALDGLSTIPEYILVDGNKFKPYKDIPYSCIVKGDSKFLSIAAASILAKNYRDKLMEKLGNEYPVYNWKNNVGYPTKEHRKSIENFGITTYHRKSFKLTENQTKLIL